MSVDLLRARARYAYALTHAWSPLTSQISSWLPGLPVLIRTQGLLVTLCLLHKDGGAAQLAHALEDWLLGRAEEDSGLPLPFSQPSPRASAIELYTRVSRPKYQAAQREAIALAEMLKLMADAYTPRPAG